MSQPPNSTARPLPKRKKIFFVRGFQLRYASLVAGSLGVLLIFAGLHGLYIANSTFPQELTQRYRPFIESSTWRLFAVGFIYIAVVTMAAVFLSHRAVGPARRLEDELRRMADDGHLDAQIRIREGDDFEGLVGAINHLLDKVRASRGR